MWISVEECGRQRPARDVAHIQAHPAGEEGECGPRADPPTEVPACNICVSSTTRIIINLDVHLNKKTYLN